ncbi:hypothetical protein [Paenibacillus mucilaginosus]|uniref:hypothetical protein n=1 Tax=Paenibacillus mucilaginosus TaxID=61624 RepID=UPI00059F4076|nr:hypothetical protein [Paenibacillus mucilaginosus]
MREKLIYAILTLLFLTLSVDGYLLFKGRIPYSNSLYRVATGAPIVSMDGVVLFYGGKIGEEVNEEDLVQFRLSDNGIALYKSKGIPDGIPKTPPYIYLKQENEVYEYTYPKPFFTVG